MRHLNASLIAALLYLVSTPGAAPLRAADAPPARETLREQAKRCRSILKTSLVDFYLPAAVDRDNGGYLESLRDGKLAPTAEKFLTLQARQLWFFSTRARASSATPPARPPRPALSSLKARCAIGATAATSPRSPMPASPRTSGNTFI